MNTLIRRTALIAALALSGLAHSQTPAQQPAAPAAQQPLQAAATAAVRTERNLSLALANRIASAAVSACQASGYSVSATVVDRADSVRDQIQ